MWRAANEWKQGPWRALCLAACATAPFASDAHAQAPEPRLLVLRSDLVDTQLQSAVDRELERVLREHGQFAATDFSPTPYSDIELAAGCQGSTDDCVTRVAQSLDADWMLVRELRKDDTGAVVLSLTAQDGAEAGIRNAQARLSKRGLSTPDRVVPRLLAVLYGPSLQVAAPVDAPVAAETSARPMRIVGYSALASSGALLATGLAMATVASKDHDRYARVDVRDTGSAERADHLLDDARQRTRVANALFVSGAVVGAGGLALLLWDHLREKKRAQPLGFDVHAGREGGFVALSGPLWSAP